MPQIENFARATETDTWQLAGDPSIREWDFLGEELGCVTGFVSTNREQVQRVFLLGRYCLLVREKADFSI